MNGNASYATPSAAPSTPSTPMQSALTQLANNIEGVHDTIISLERRMGRTLLPVPPAAEEKGTGPVAVPMASDMLEEIESLTRRVIGANARLLDMIERTQL